MPASLTNSNISTTYPGVMHAFGVELPVSGQQRIYDGVGNASSIWIGRNCEGVSICGPLSAQTVSLSSILVPCGVNVTLAAVGAPLQIGASSSTNVVFDCDEIQARNNGASGPLYINRYGGQVRLGATLSAFGDISSGGDIIAYATSDAQLKDEVVNISSPLKKLQQINGVEFIWNEKQTRYTGRDVGVIAQEVEQVFPEIVTTREDGFKAVKYEKLVPLLIEGIKELQKQVVDLQNKLNKISIE